MQTAARQLFLGSWDQTHFFLYFRLFLRLLFLLFPPLHLTRYFSVSLSLCRGGTQMFSTGLSPRSKQAEALRCASVHLPPSHSLACSACSASSGAEASADWLLAKDKHSVVLCRHKYIKSEFKWCLSAEGGRERERENRSQSPENGEKRHLEALCKLQLRSPAQTSLQETASCFHLVWKFNCQISVKRKEKKSRIVVLSCLCCEAAGAGTANSGQTDRQTKYRQQDERGVSLVSTRPSGGLDKNTCRCLVPTVPRQLVRPQRRPPELSF